MRTLTLDETTLQLLAQEPPTEGGDLDTKVHALLKSEYLHRLSRYRYVDRLMVDKYGVEFHEFVSRRVTQREGYSREVESDAMSWETAISGIGTLERKLGELNKGEQGKSCTRFTSFKENIHDASPLGS
jgi:hypothetical protein